MTTLIGFKPTTPQPVVAGEADVQYPLVDFTVFDDVTGEPRWTGKQELRYISTMAPKGMTAVAGLFAPEVKMVNGKPIAGQSATSRVEPSQVKLAAAQRLRRTDWRVVKAMETGIPLSPEHAAERQRIRDRSNEIEQMKLIPVDYDDDRWWV